MTISLMVRGRSLTEWIDDLEPEAAPRSIEGRYPWHSVVRREVLEAILEWRKEQQK